MRLQHYINEGIDTDEDMINDLNGILKNDCKPYLKLIKGKDPLYRGMYIENTLGNQILDTTSRDVGIKNVRQDRNPKGTNKTTFKKMNTWLAGNQHNRRDDTVLCTTDDVWASGFASLYYIFPIGKISYTWIDSKDFNRNSKETGWRGGAPDMYMDNDERSNPYNPVLSKLKKPFPKYFHTDTDFNTPYKKGYEIWIKCDSYYYVYVDLNIVWDEKYQVFV